MLPLLLGIHFKQAIEALEDVQVFLEHRGYVEQATSVGKVMINLAGISVRVYRSVPHIRPPSRISPPYVFSQSSCTGIFNDLRRNSYTVKFKVPVATQA